MKKILSLVLAFSLTASLAFAQTVDVGPSNINPTSVGTAAVGQIPGTTTNDNACTGCVGEFVSSNIVVGSAVSLVSNNPTNITTLSLTAGDWEVWGLMNSSEGAGTTLTYAQVSFNTTSATEPASSTSNPGPNLYQPTQAPTTNFSVQATRTRFSLSAPATVYFIVRSVFGVSTLSAYGWAAARRVR